MECRETSECRRGDLMGKDPQPVKRSAFRLIGANAMYFLKYRPIAKFTEAILSKMQSANFLIGDIREVEGR